MLYSSDEKGFEPTNYLINKKIRGQGEALAKLQEELHHSQSCGNDQNQNNGLNSYVQLEKDHCKFMFQSIEMVTLNKNLCTLHIPFHQSLSVVGNHGSSTSQ